MTAPIHPPLVQRLLEPGAYPHPTDGIRLVETHISWVFITGPFAYKVKKPVDFGFLNFTTLERRRGFCEAEVQISGRFAPEIYLAAVPITGSADEPRVEGAGPPIEWAVKLVQFDEAERLDNLFAAGRLTAADCERLGAEIARVEESLAVADTSSGWGTAAQVRSAVAAICARLRDARPDTAGRIVGLESWIAHMLDAADGRRAARRRPRAGVSRRPASGQYRASWWTHDGLRRHRVQPGVALDRRGERRRLSGDGSAVARPARSRRACGQ
jgi:hypothetical protein